MTKTEIRKNIRHDLDRKRVETAMNRHIAEYERYRARKKKELADKPSATTLEDIDKEVDGWIAYERSLAAHIRVIELPISGPRFLLSFEDIPDDEVTGGSGLFPTFEEAATWFYRGGR